jgi:hypothetical protein
VRRRVFVQILAAPLASAPPKIQVEDDGMVSVNGSRTFISGLYQLPRMENPWREARSAGFNLVRTTREQLGDARKHGLYAWIALGAISPAKRAADEARIRGLVSALKDDPALLFWETEDEPTFVWKKNSVRVPPEVVIETHRFVKAIDPVHPFYLNHSPTNLESTLRRYNSGADLIATDIYPVIPHGIRELYALWPDGQQGDLLNPYISQVGEYADKMRRVAGPSRAVFMVLQAFAWEKLREKNQDPAMVLYPTRQQTRFMAYQAVVHGANGIIYWGLNYTPVNAPVWTDLKAVMGEFSELKEELANRPASLALKLEYHDTGHSLDRGVEWIAKPGRDSVVLIAVNADRNPVDLTFHGLDRFRSCRLLFESSRPNLVNGRLRATFAPFDVRVYRLAPF